MDNKELLIELTKLIKSEVKEAVREEIEPIKADIKEMKSDIGILKSDVNTLKSDVNTLKSDVNTLKSEVRRISIKVEKNHYTMLDGFNTLEALINRNTQRIDESLSNKNNISH